MFSGAHASSPLRPDLVEGGFDILCVRELTGGLYFGQPKGSREENGERVAVDTMIYRASEVQRIGRLAFEIARGRKRKLTSVDKMNVLENGLLWRSVMKELAADVSGRGTQPSAGRQRCHAVHPKSARL